MNVEPCTCAGWHTTAGYWHAPSCPYNTLSSPPPRANVGWECPRCGACHAPHVDRCTCSRGSTAAGSAFRPKLVV